MIAAAFQLLGLTLEIIGVLLMANLYVGLVSLLGAIPLLASALVKGKAARGAVYLLQDESPATSSSAGQPVNQDNKLTSLQGLAFIGLGFLIQAIGVLLAAISIK